MKYWRPEFNFGWGTLKDTDVKRIMITPFHEFVIELQDGTRIKAITIKAQ